MRPGGGVSVELVAVGLNYKDTLIAQAADLIHKWIKRPHAVGAVPALVMELWKQGLVKPPTTSRSHSVSGTDTLASSRSPCRRSPASFCLLRRSSSSGASRFKSHSGRAYNFAGGLGSLGRPVCTWVAEGGAGELLVLSRSAGTLPEQAQFATELDVPGCKAALMAGNVAMYEDGVGAGKAASKPAPGDLQAVMAPQDNFRVTSYADWLAATGLFCESSSTLRSIPPRRSARQMPQEAGGARPTAMRPSRLSRRTQRATGQWLNKETELLECHEHLATPVGEGMIAGAANNLEAGCSSRRCQWPSDRACHQPPRQCRLPWRGDRRLLGLRTTRRQMRS